MLKLLICSLLCITWTYASFFEYGHRYGDQALPFSKEQRAVALDIPFSYLETSHNEIFISSNGIISFSQALPEEVLPLSSLKRNAIAVFYAEAVSGTVHYRATSSDQRLLRQLTDHIRRLFADAKDFTAIQGVVITWVDVMNKEETGGATFQLALVTDGMTSFALLQYQSLPWFSSGGVNAQSGFSHSDGRVQPNVNSGTAEIVKLVRESNSEQDGLFAFRMSGAALEDPKELTDDYEYQNYDNDYDGDKRQPADCPKDKYNDRCPEGCNVLADDRGCSKCVCAEPPTDEELQEALDVNRLPEYRPQHNQRSQQHEEKRVEETEEEDDDEEMQNVEEEIHIPSAAEQQPAAPEAPPAPVVEQQDGKPTCAVYSESECHANAACRDSESGFCCECRSGFYGNGRTCLKEREPQRIGGFFEGAINGKSIDRTDLHTFISAVDGSAYTALSKIPSDLGHTMMLLLPIASVMGWLFAEVKSQNGYNGFQLTGGFFNRTVTAQIGDRYYVTIRQQFTGRDLYDYFNANIFVSGTLPDISPQAQVNFPDYDEQFRREGPGSVRSYSSMEAIVRDGSQQQSYRITVDQQIQYKECAFMEFTKDKLVQLQVRRVHVTYDENEGIVRYGSRNYIADPNSQNPPREATDRRQHGQTQQQVAHPVGMSSADACAEGRHQCTLPNMKCRVVEPSYRCECFPGYQAEADTASPIGWKCIDLDECSRGDSQCDVHAICTNTEGSYKCHCKDGFTGDGRYCTSSEVAAQPAVEMSPAEPASPQQKGSCTNHQQCHQWGECVFTPGTPTGYCKCRGWYTGDGVEHCGPPDERPALNANIPQRGGTACGSVVCDVNAECMPERSGGSECVCKAGFVGNGINCESLLDEQQQQQQQRTVLQPAVVGTVCRSHDECSEFGSCAYDNAVGYYQCICTEPYVGNGVECTMPGQTAQQTAVASVGCDVTRDCSPHAECVYERTSAGSSYKCVCMSGYSGDGKSCVRTLGGLPPLEPPGCDIVRNCHVDAQCNYDSHNKKYRCECNEHFVGDGITCVSISSRRQQEGSEVVIAPSNACRDQSDCHTNAHCVTDATGGGYICECLAGFRGDGVNECNAADQCTPMDRRSCHQNAECVFGEEEGAYVCKCVQGFTGDGVSCAAFARPSTCLENARLCHANAQCVYNHQQNTHVCICKPGAIGDGHSRCDVQETPRCTGCSIHGHCAENPTTGGWQCKCNVGYNGNGHVCAAATSCFDDRSLCHANAECVPGEHGHYVCNCHYGYHGDGRNCMPDSGSRSDNLLVARGMAIFQRGTTPEILGKQLIVIPHHIAVGLDFDCRNERIVWADISGHSIRTSSFNGSDTKAFYTDLLNSPEGIAVDAQSGNVYYADSLNDEIGVASLDGKYRKSLVIEGLENPRAVALDLQNKHVYYTDWHREHPFIGRVGMDGKGASTFLADDIHLPNGITVLPNRRELCWVDAGSHRLSCIGFNGSNRRVVYANLQYPFGITHENEERFYWTDWKDNRIHTVGVYGDGYGSFPISLGGSGKVYGIVSIPKTCNLPPSACSVNNGGCEYLCLPSEHGAHCQCPDNAAVKNC